MIVDMYAGAGGVSQGLRMAGRTDVVGIDVDRLACTIATLAGHERIVADALDPLAVAVLELAREAS